MSSASYSIIDEELQDDALTSLTTISTVLCVSIGTSISIDSIRHRTAIAAGMAHSSGSQLVFAEVFGGLVEGITPLKLRSGSHSSEEIDGFLNGTTAFLSSHSDLAGDVFRVSSKVAQLLLQYRNERFGIRAELVLGSEGVLFLPIALGIG
jgi:hypothetical protein